MMMPIKTAGFVRLTWMISWGVVSAARFAPQTIAVFQAGAFSAAGWTEHAGEW
jgi:hypothetical protein